MGEVIKIITLNTFQMVMVRIYDPPYCTLKVMCSCEEILLVAIVTSMLAGGVGLQKDEKGEQRKNKDKYCNQSPLLYNPIVSKGKKEISVTTYVIPLDNSFSFPLELRRKQG